MYGPRPDHRDEFFELSLQLLEQPCRALGALPYGSHLRPQLEKRDQRLVVRQIRPRTCNHRLARSRASRSACSGARAHTVRWKTVRLRATVLLHRTKKMVLF